MITPPFRAAARTLCCAAALSLAACATVEKYTPSWMGVYRIDINQGNYLSQDMVDKLKVGMTKQQVKLVLGTPLITSAFRDNRWDYVYEFERQGRMREHRNFTVWFAEDKLARWEGDQMPESVVELNRSASDKALRLPKDDNTSFLDRIKDIFKRE